MQRASGVGKEGRGNPNSRERYCANWWADIPSLPYGKGDVRKSVGLCLTMIEEGISNKVLLLLKKKIKERKKWRPRRHNPNQLRTHES